MDKILSYLPDNVHVRFGWEHEPQYYGGVPDTEYKVILLPKIWLKHNKRGSWNEWEIKQSFRNKLYKEFGIDHWTEQLQILEWNQMENIGLMLKKAKQIGFNDILERINNMNFEDAIYKHENFM